ncbi:selenium metabolism-associated LysR family transcriptional regulator [Paraclostridium sordellii]|uniref:LysR family transcriptional regulator n=1 Tax=Paraclostridium sordellii TaxID=1505 RepID=A0A0C7HTZ5_PARSO|nr:selenium metabolism-associated LysR family transcriptional regulator [Paeniclostridium sordellii]QYE98466.1 LysR family transcriptional regulator [Paeniclostridium sordellii]CEN79684.1 LysR family transcriptional regulator [[Clostridium] sordellii] [Paeniclostridium sordellii]CEO05372.1 LysR family transcriptional regulator [[Clostridium] sordellii] [Paeniclostridium sordellii]CEO26104.1 LysR family transcriptional regulator [[Clostridium] sordellii] [Paeniclostridium sordellii]CEP86024.1 L
MDLKQLEVFVAVAKYNSFSKAAKELFLTQPTVSAHIQNLEKNLDTVLVNRNNKVITLTKAGEILYEHAIYILNNCKKAVYDIKEYSGKIEGVIDIACSSIPETYILPDFLKNFYNDYPNVKFSISRYDSQDAISEILNERISFGFVGSKINNKQVEYIDLIDDELVLITPFDLIIENEDNYIDLDKLSDLKFIMRKDGSGTQSLLINKLKSHKIPINNLDTIAYVESNESIKEMVKLGLGVSFVSYTSVIDYINLRKVRYYKIKNLNFDRKFYFIYSKKKTFTPLEYKFLDGVFDYFNINKKDK